MSSSIPPDLRVVCRKLTSLPTSQLPHSLPSLVNHVLRCRVPLSTPKDPKAKGEAAESAMLVHKLKERITTLLKSRAPEERFAAVALIKAAVDVGGWEVLKDSGPWVRGLLSIVQKGDSLAVKELAIVVMTRIYILLQPYQTLVREIATQTMTEFAKACLQLIKPSSPDEVSSAPLVVIATICDAFSTLVPLYPATLRPFSNQIQTAVRFFLAPTESDSVTVPESLKQSARRLVASQHFAAAKSGGTDEWAKLVDSILVDLHATADQIFRAIDESWEPAGGISRTKVQIDQELSGGGSGPSQLPTWRGVQGGSQRLVGLFDYLATVLRHSTKGPVTIPLTKVMDAATRVCLIARLSPKTQTWEQSLQTTAAIGREEKDELWSVMPDIHISALRLVQAMFQQLGDDMRPYASETLDQIMRVLNSSMGVPDVRSTSYAALNQVLSVAGPTLPKHMVDLLQPAIGAACRDLQEDSGHLQQAKKVSSSATDTKKNSLAANADLFLQKPQSATDAPATVSLHPTHRTAATTLLASLLSNISQQHLKPSLRALLDQTAILTRNRDAMVASVLHPYTDQRGRRYPSILPHLTREFPNDQEIEILRTNLRNDGPAGSREPSPMSDDEDEAEDKVMDEAETTANDEPTNGSEEAPLKVGSLPAGAKVELPVQSNPFEASGVEETPAQNSFVPRASSPPKRKNEEPAAAVPPKRQELEKSAESTQPAATSKPNIPEDDDDDDSDESVHLNMELEEDEEEEDGE